MKITLKTLSPVKIGTREGKELDRMNSFVVGDKIVKVNMDKAFSENPEHAKKIVKLIEKEIEKGKEFFEEKGKELFEEKDEYWNFSASFIDDYSKELFQRKGEINPQIMQADNTIYLPGSSLKGALRTNLLTYYYMNNPSAWWFKEDRIDRNVEKYFRVGKDDPQRDCMKGFQVSDSESKPADEAGLVFPVKTYSKNYDKLKPKHWETLHMGIAPGTEFGTEINLHEDLIARMAKKWNGEENIKEILGGFSEEKIIDKVIEAATMISRERIERDLKYLKSCENSFQYGLVIDQLEELREVVMERDSAVFNMGFGMGRLSSTIQIAAKDDKVKKKLRERYAHKGYQKGDIETPWPKTRRFYRKEKEPTGELGWIKMEVER